MMSDTAAVHVALRAARVLRGETQREVAARAEISPSRLSEIETGWRRPRPEELARLVTALGLAADSGEPA